MFLQVYDILAHEEKNRNVLQLPLTFQFDTVQDREDTDSNISFLRT